MEYTQIILQLFTLLFLIYIIIVLLYSMIKGAPYAPLGQKKIDTMLKLLDPKKGKKLADLGSGDGRIIIKASEIGIRADGYEINPFLYIFSKLKTLKNKNAGVFLKDYWNTDFSKYDYITIYGVFYIMPRLEEKLLEELKPGSKIVTNYFKFPNLKPDKKKDGLYLYIIR